VRSAAISGVAVRRCQSPNRFVSENDARKVLAGHRSHTARNCRLRISSVFPPRAPPVFATHNIGVNPAASAAMTFLLTRSSVSRRIAPLRMANNYSPASCIDHMRRKPHLKAPRFPHISCAEIEIVAPAQPPPPPSVP